MGQKQIRIMTKRIIIIGGGFAGLSASAELSSSGYPVTLIEQRRYLGGRAFSFFDRNIGIELDNGQHILMGCYENTFRFLRMIGAMNHVNIQDNLHIDFLDACGHAYGLDFPRLPAPFHAALGVLRFEALSFTDRVKMLRITREVLSDNPMNSSKDCTVSDWLNRLGQSQKSQDNFWNILTFAVMNESPDIASASLFKTVLRKALFTNRQGSRIVLPAVPLSRLYVDHAEDYIKKNGGEIEKACPASEIVIEKEVVSGIRLQDGRIMRGDYYISAVPYPVLQRILPDEILERHSPYFSGMNKLTPSPIVSIHMLFDKAVTEFPFAALINSPIQWVFNKEQVFGDSAYRGLLSFVISGAHLYVPWNGDRLLGMAQAELKRIFPKAGSAKLLYSKIIKERSATFSPSPGIQQNRPTQKTPIRNLFLAGDWTETGLPATIEGAVISGFRSAEGIVGSGK